MSIAAEDDDRLDGHRTPPRSILFSELPRQPLDQGRGGARELWADLDDDLNLRWQLRVVDIKDSAGLLLGAAGTQHQVVGIAGPQVAVRIGDSSRVLRREHVLPVPSSRVLFERPKLRPPGVSSLIVLTFAGAVDPPQLVIRTLDAGGSELPAGARLLLALRGTVRVDGAEVSPGSALLLDPEQAHRPRAAGASLLTVQLPNPACRGRGGGRSTSLGWGHEH